MLFKIEKTNRPKGINEDEFKARLIKTVELRDEAGGEVKIFRRSHGDALRTFLVVTK